MITTNNTRFIKEIRYNSADDFLQAISYKGELYNTFDSNFIFRGHSTDKYKLLPTALRLDMYNETYPNAIKDELHALCAVSEYGQIEAEAQVLFDFYKKCDDAHLYVPNERRLRESFLFPVDYRILLQDENWRADEYQELAALAQHYGVPTRLLDWTSNICVALYFASSSAIKKMVEPERLSRFEWTERCRIDLETISDCVKTKQLPHKKEEHIEIWALDKSVQYAVRSLLCP